MAQGVEVGRIRKGELSRVVEIWNESFRGELSQRGADLGEIAPIFRALLSFRRFPLWAFHRMGVPVEVWVVRVRGRAVGAAGQIGYRIPYIIGLVVEGESRELRLVRILERGIAAGLKAAGFPLMRALVPAGHGIAKLAVKLGWEPLGNTIQLVLPLGEAPRRVSSPKARPLSFRREGALAQRFEREKDIRALLSLERNYGGPAVAILGFRERVLGAVRGKRVLGIARISWNAYQPVAFMHVPWVEEPGAYGELLAYAVELFTRLKKRELRLDLWEDQGELLAEVGERGAREVDRWTYFVKRLGSPFR